MLREINDEEMEMVSGGGDCYQIEGDTTCYDSLEDANAAAQNQAELRDGNSDGYGGTGWGPDGDRGFFEQVGNIIENPFTEGGILTDQTIADIGNLVNGYSLPSSYWELSPSGRLIVNAAIALNNLVSDIILNE